jgi:phospholipid/cholesterol/gamma-HCH transport system substrate-binding protein
MENKINYTIVGLFVVILMTGLLSVTFWLTRQYGQQTYDTYFVHLSESVAGLNMDATVKYRGVDVGSVVRIGLKADNPEVVELLLKINQNIPIKTDTTAALNFYGITGLAYVELEGIDKQAPLLKRLNGAIPVIPSRPSTLKRIDQSLSQFAEKSIETLENINLLLGDKNINNVERLLFESTELVKDLRVQLKGIRTLVDNGVVMENKIAATTEKISAASTSIKRMADNIEKNTTGFSQEMTRGIRTSFSALNQLLSDLDILTATLQTTLQDIKNSPADLLFKRTQPNPGPGEDGYHEK